MNRGFYVASHESDCWGFSFALVYNTNDRNLQLHGCNRIYFRIKYTQTAQVL